MKLDLSATWDGAVEMIGTNREIVLVLAGVFFFLPSLAFTLLIPDAGVEAAASGPEPDFDKMIAAINAFMTDYWWAVLLLSLVQSVGVIATLSALGDPSRPIVSEAIGRGVAMLPTVIAAQILSALIIFAPVFVITVLAALAGAQAVAALLFILALPVIVYLMVKLLLATPAIAIERRRNPIAALARSWSLTKGNSFRLFFFYALLIVAVFVLSTVIGLVFGLLLSLLGESLALIGSAIVNGLMNAIFPVVACAVLASLHRRLASGASPAGVPHSKKD